MDYKNAGVDIEAGYKSVELMKKHIQQTMREEVLGGIGGFSGAFSLCDRCGGEPREEHGFSGEGAEDENHCAATHQQD